MAFFSLLIQLLVNCIFYVYGLQVPSSPCPDIFQYLQDKNGDYYGEITFPYTDGARFNISAGVAAWMPGYYPDIKVKHVEITMTTPYDDLIKNTTSTLAYRVDFPFKTVIPLISLIGLNDKIYCNGPPVPPNDGSVEFTTCGQTHYLDFPSVCEVNQPTDEKNTFGLSSYSKNVKNDDPADLDSSVAKDNEPRSTQDQYLDTPLFGTDNQKSEQTQYINFPPYTEKLKPSDNTPHLDFPPYGINSQSDLKKEEELQNSLVQSNKIARATDTFSSYNEICGRPASQKPEIQLRILHGQEVERGAYPWLVAIFRTLNNFGLNYICSGSLVSNKHVITAAHCMMMDSRRTKSKEIACILGKLNIGTWGITDEEKMLQPESIDIHPDYKRGQANADIAVITLAESISFNKMIKPLCLWQGSNELNEVVGNMGIVVGWGKQENDVDITEPKQVSMPIVDQFKCVKGSTSAVEHALLEIVSDNTFCAGLRNGSGPCMGDSGSAFLLKRDDVFYLRGIVSTAVADESIMSCNLQEYVVFTDASKYLEWLMSILK